MKSNVDETMRLVCLLLERQITAADFQRLDELLEQDAEARRIYIQSMHMHEQLPETILQHIGDVSPTFSLPGNGTLRFAFPVGVALLASIVLAAVSLFTLLRDSNQMTGSEDIAFRQEVEPTDPNVAVVTAAIDVDWGSSVPLGPGDGAAPGTLKLKSGVLHLEFYSGASVLLEGPAEFDLKSPTLAVLSSGRLRAHVPPEARGFTILSPQWKLVDQGTEFGVIASENGETQVHVFDGLVDLYPNTETRVDEPLKQSSIAAKAQQLSTGDAVLFRADGERQEIEAKSKDFLSFAQAAEMVDKSIGQRRETWLQWKQAFQMDPRVYAWFDFEQQSISLRRMHGVVPTIAPLTGTLVGCRVAEGRWPQETSLEFKHPGDRVRLSLPEEIENMTVMAWLRIDGLDRSFSGLLMSDENLIGRPHWQINGRGNIVFGVRDHQNLHNYKSGTVIDDFLLGRWIHITTVYDASGRVVKHYLNGILVSSEEIVRPVSLFFGNTEIGNWKNPMERTRTPIRSLNGRIDELIIFRAVVPGDEIQRIYEFGRP